MAKITPNNSKPTRKSRPALTPEARELQLQALATDLAEKQLRDGTASSQVITHYLKLATLEYQVKLKTLENQARLMEAKTEVLQSQKKSEELYENAIKAMRNYAGQGDPDEY